MKKQILLTIAAMLLPMSMMAQGYHFVNHANGLEYILADGDPEDDDHLFIWVGGSKMTELVDGETVMEDRYFFQQDLRPALRRAYNSDQGKFYKSALDAIKSVTTTVNNPDNYKGIEYFTALESLSIASKNAAAVDLDLSKNSKLKSLTFSQTGIKLRTLNLKGTQLTSLPTIPSGSSTTLTNLNVSNTKITSLNVSVCSNLRVLDADDLNFTGALTLPTAANKLEEVSVERSTGITSIDVGKYTALSTLHVNGSTVNSLTLPTATGVFKHLNMNDTDMGSTYTHANPLDISMYPRLMMVAEGGMSGSNTGGELFYDNSGLALYSDTEGNFIIYPSNTERIIHTCTSEEQLLDYMDYSGHPNLIYLKLTGANGLVLPDNRTVFGLDLTGSPNIEEVSFSNSASTLTGLDAVNVKKLDVSDCSKLQTLLYTGPMSEELVLSSTSGAHPDLTELVLSKSSVSSIDLTGGGTSATCIAPNLEIFRAYYSALQEINLSNHAKLTTLSLLPPKTGDDDETVEKYGIDNFNEGYKLKKLNISNCTSLEGAVTLGFVADDWLFYNQLEDVDASGCTKITRFECPNNLLENLDLSGCSDLELININQGTLTGDGDIDVSGCPKLTTFYGHHHPWTSMDFLLSTSGGRTAAEIGALKVLHCDGGTYTLVKDGNRYVRKDKNNQEMVYTSRLESLDLSNLVNGTFEELNCEDNLIKSLDISGVGPGMTVLKCANNMMLTLNLNSLNNSTLEEGEWSPQVAYLDAEVVKGGVSTSSTLYDGAYDWVALHLSDNEGYTHSLDNYLFLYDNLWGFFNEVEPLADESKPWMCLVEETDVIPDFTGDYLHHGTHTGYYLFLHSQTDITTHFGAYKDQDLYGKVMTYRYNTGYNRVLGTNPTNSKIDTPTETKITAANDLDPHIDIRAHLWPYIINLNPATMNEESKAKGVDYYSSTLCLDYDAVVPEGVQCYFVTGIKSKKTITHTGTNQVDNQLTMALFAGDNSKTGIGGGENRILPANTPVYVRSKMAAGLYSFETVWDFDYKGWENLKNIEGYPNAPHILHGVQPGDTRITKPAYVEALAHARSKKAEMMYVDDDGKKVGNILTGVLGEKYDETNMEAENFNVYSRSDTTLAAKRTCLGLGLQTQKKDPVTGQPTKVIGFWPYNGTSVPAHRCIILEKDYYDAVAAAEAAGVEIAPDADSKGGMFVFDDEVFDVTGIDTVNEEQAVIDDNWYNMQGVRLNKRPTRHGVYIYNGKKVTIK